MGYVMGMPQGTPVGWALRGLWGQGTDSGVLAALIGGDLIAASTPPTRSSIAKARRRVGKT